MAVTFPVKYFVHDHKSCDHEIEDKNVFDIFHDFKCKLRKYYTHRVLLGIIGLVALFITEGIQPQDEHVKLLPGSNPPKLLNIIINLIPHFHWFYINTKNNTLYKYYNASKWEKIGFGLLMIGCVLQHYCRYLLQNNYTMSISIKPNHSVYKDDIYSIIRHPGYLSTILMFGGTLLFCQNISSMIACGVPVFLIGKICPDEEQFLKENLAGYAEYMDQVKYKILPLIY
eukprot:252741_1